MSAPVFYVLGSLVSGSSCARKRSNASKFTGSNWPKPCIHTLACFNASGSSLHHFTRPRFSWLIKPALVRTTKCFDMAASDISNGSATSVTAISSSNRSVRICRRVGSANAAKTVSRSGCTPFCTGLGHDAKAQSLGCCQTEEGRSILPMGPVPGSKPMSRA